MKAVYLGCASKEICEKLIDVLLVKLGEETMQFKVDRQSRMLLDATYSRGDKVEVEEVMPGLWGILTNHTSGILATAI